MVLVTRDDFGGSSRLRISVRSHFSGARTFGNFVRSQVGYRCRLYSKPDIVTPGPVSWIYNPGGTAAQTAYRQAGRSVEISIVKGLRIKEIGIEKYDEEDYNDELMNPSGFSVPGWARAAGYFCVNGLLEELPPTFKIKSFDAPLAAPTGGVWIYQAMGARSDTYGASSVDLKFKPIEARPDFVCSLSGRELRNRVLEGDVLSIEVKSRFYKSGEIEAMEFGVEEYRYLAQQFFCSPHIKRFMMCEAIVPRWGRCGARITTFSEAQTVKMSYWLLMYDLFSLPKFFIGDEAALLLAAEDSADYLVRDNRLAMVWIGLEIATKLGLDNARLKNDVRQLSLDLYGFYDFVTMEQNAKRLWPVASRPGWPNLNGFGDAIIDHKDDLKPKKAVPLPSFSVVGAPDTHVQQGMSERTARE